MKKHKHSDCVSLLPFLFLVVLDLCPPPSASFFLFLIVCSFVFVGWLVCFQRRLQEADEELEEAQARLHEREKENDICVRDREALSKRQSVVQASRRMMIRRRRRRRIKTSLLWSFPSYSLSLFFLHHHPSSFVPPFVL